MMVLPENNNSKANATVTKDNKHPCSSSMSGSARRTEAPSLRPPEQALKCPRCDSANTKFCYYNNYSLTQPRHFCKTCRRYWTKGGALRNVPIGGGCRKSKKAKSGSRLDSSGDSSSSSDIVGATGFKFLSPAVDFPAASGISFPRFHSKLSTSYEVSGFGAEQVGGFRSTYSLPSPASVGFVAATAAGGGSMNVHGTVATSIESLSCMNQELQWKLQQQRLASVVFGAVGDNHYRSSNHKDSTDSLRNHAEVIKPQATGSSLLRSLEGSRHGTSEAAAEEWFFGCSVPPAANAAVQLGAKSRGGGGGQEGSGSGGWNGGQVWTSDLLPYSGMP